MTRKVAFLDRDGTINVDHGYVYKATDWEFTKDAIHALRRLIDFGFAIAVVTNQSGIASGRYSSADVDQLHEFMQLTLENLGVQVDAIAVCPHHQDDRCKCRKPQLGLACDVRQQLNEDIEYAASWTIGDKLSDIEFGRKLGTHTALIRSRYWNDLELDNDSTLVVESLSEAVDQIVST